MRPKIAISLFAVAVLAACAEADPGTPPPLDQFHYPVSMVASADGKVLYVVNSNFDRRYNRGTVFAVDVGGNVDAPLATLVKGTASIDSFGGEIAKFNNQLFVPTRNGNGLFALDIGTDPFELTCHGQAGVSDCEQFRTSLVGEGGQQVDDPFGTAIDPINGYLYVTALKRTDGIAYTAQVKLDLSQITYLSSTAAADDAVFVANGPEAAPEPLIFLTGRYNTTADQPLRFIQPTSSEPFFAVATSSGFSSTGVTDSRSLEAVRDPVNPSANLTRLFMTTRGAATQRDTRGEGPDGLVVFNVAIDGPDLVPEPDVLIDTFVSLPRCGASDLLAIDRSTLVPPRRPLVAISCTLSNTVLLYDDDLGQVVEVVSGIQEPYGMASVPLGEGARLFVASFGGGQVDYIDLPALVWPFGATSENPLQAKVLGRGQ